MGGSQAACAQAVVLVGGEGTRLRPLTSLVPKPMVPLVERPFIGYLLDNLARHGVPHVIFSMGYLSDALRGEVGDGSGHGIRASYVVEDRPLGTAGAIRNAAGLLEDGCLLALNGDVLTDVDVTELVAFHRRHGARATILLTPVDDPRRYGLVRLGDHGNVLQFIEKPGAEDQGPGLINAGIYVLEHDVLDLIPPGQNFSIERGVFPKLAAEGTLYGYVGESYWRDIGTPESYLQAHFDLLERALDTAITGLLGEGYVYIAPSASVSPAARVVPPAYVGEGVTIGGEAQIGPLAVVGAASVVGAHAQVKEAVLQDAVILGVDAYVEHSVVARRCTVGDRSRVVNGVLGEGCRVGADNVVARGCCLFPGTVLGDGSVMFRDTDGREAR